MRRSEWRGLSPWSDLDWGSQPVSSGEELIPYGAHVVVGSVGWRIGSTHPSQAEAEFVDSSLELSSRGLVVLG